ncbi:hypothetical protein [Brevifollis gellanilyticus]|uniref:Uncharacterized protein n=1 Tax=Brevifollis gellanilyticus TaxID=748831 RepID=A0A512M2L8_9BACT|nr:hypothetical protein [Brevifollis gellanilyticus]GEP40983.1 hypothetical protein BGE01nite_02740 [Brevifollis gellanilyticus]
MKRKLQALIVLLLLGAVRLPMEQYVTHYYRTTGLLSAPLSLGLRDNLSQMGFAASLGGLRSLVATISYLRAYREWENVNWAKVDSLMQLTTNLQPRYENYWDEAAWHMAYNAASAYLYDEKIETDVRTSLYKEHVQRGIDILKRGLQFTPESARLWSTLGDIYANRTENPREATLAAEAYLQVFRLSRNERYARFAAHQYSLTPDPAKWRKAYDMLSAFYQKKRVSATLLDDLKKLEVKLNIPFPQRIPTPGIPIEAPADPYTGVYR